MKVATPRRIVWAPKQTMAKKVTQPRRANMPSRSEQELKIICTRLDSLLGFDWIPVEGIPANNLIGFEPLFGFFRFADILK